MSAMDRMPCVAEVVVAMMNSGSSPLHDRAMRMRAEIAEVIDSADQRYTMLEAENAALKSKIGRIRDMAST